MKQINTLIFTSRVICENTAGRGMFLRMWGKMPPQETYRSKCCILNTECQRFVFPNETQCCKHGRNSEGKKGTACIHVVSRDVIKMASGRPRRAR